MRDEVVSRLLAQVDSEPGFRERLLREPAAALAAAGPQGAWTPALAGEDVLRRLAGASPPGDARVWTWVKKKLSKLFCGPGGTRSWECPKKPTP